MFADKDLGERENMLERRGKIAGVWFLRYVIENLKIPIKYNRRGLIYFCQVIKLWQNK